MTGTAVVFLSLSEAAFSGGKPFKLTAGGESVAKNRVRVSTGPVVGTGRGPLAESSEIELGKVG